MALDDRQRHAVPVPVLSMAALHAPDEAYPRPALAWYGVAVLLLALTVSFVDRQILSLMVQPVRADLGLSDTQISLLHGFAFVIFYTVLGVPLGRWADRRSRKLMIIGGMVVWCCATAACGLAQNFEQLFTARIFVGVGEAALSPAAYSLIADSFPRQRRARAMSVYSLGILVGSGLALILGGLAVAATAKAGSLVLPLVGEVRSWQAAFIMVGLPGLLVAALMATIREPSRKERGSGDTSLSGTWRFIRERVGVFTLLSVGLGLTGGTIAFGIGAWLPTTFIRVHHWAPGQVAGAMGVILLTFGVAGVLLGGWLADRAAKRGETAGALKVAILGVVGMIPVVPIIGLATDPWVALAAFAWLNVFLGMPTALAIPVLHNITPNEHRGQVTALYLFVANAIGLGLGPTLVALTTDRVFHDDNAVGLSMALVITTAALLGLALLLAARRPYPRHIIHHP